MSTAPSVSAPKIDRFLRLMTSRGASDFHMTVGRPPMLRVSGPDLVVAACNAGVVGAFPTKNARTADQLDASCKEQSSMQDE